jgi:tetratricopeptide (TPR) repeat protein
MNLLAATYSTLGDSDRAAQLYAEALPLERLLYPGDIQLARTLEGTSNVLSMRGLALEALPLADEALNLALRIAGENSLDAAVAYANAAEVHRALGNTERALPLLRKAYAFYLKELGPDYPCVASTLSRLGRLQMDDGDLALAEQSIMEAVRSLERTCPACLLELSRAEDNLGMLRLRQKRYGEADQALTHSVALQRQFLLKPGSELAGTLQALAAVREKERRFDDAANLKGQAQAIRSYR